MAKRKRSRKRRGLSGLGEVTKKDFIGIAAVLCRTGADAPVVRGISQYFATQNPNFSQDRFIAASRCGKAK